MLQASLWLFVLSLAQLVMGANNFLISLSTAKVLLVVGLIASLCCFTIFLANSKRYDKHF